MPGVLDASANWKQQSLIITVEEGQQPNVDAITKAIEESNFTLSGASS